MKTFKDFLTEIRMPNYIVTVAKKDKDKANFIARSDYGDRYTKDGAWKFILTNKARLSKLVYHFLMQNISIEKIQHVEGGKVIANIDPKDLV